MSQLSFTDLCNAFDNAATRTTSPIKEPVKTSSRMISPDVARKQFICLFAHTGRNLRRWDVFRDFITLAASELDMARIRTPENIEQSRKICARYDVADLDNLKTLFCLMVTALEGKCHDFLGSLYMELELGSGDMGQFFTPYSIQRLMAQCLSGNVTEVVQKQGWIALSEPACGSAGMVIASAECMLESGLNPAEHLYAMCVDIDSIAADMAFIQLGLLGIPAKVVTGNTLTNKFNRVRYTPVYYINGWAQKLALRKEVDAIKEFMSQMA